MPSKNFADVDIAISFSRKKTIRRMICGVMMKEVKMIRKKLQITESEHEDDSDL
jgi:hypothetical protein